MRIKTLSLFLFAFLLLISAASTASCEKVLILEMSDSITTVSDDMVNNALAIAESEDYEALVITLNTPGGGLQETLNIIESIDASPVPVIGYVYPEGTKAWSAGTLILISTDIAAMTPFTVIGSAQPVQASPAGGSEPINDSKTINAIVALSKEKASKHDRNVTAAELFITENLNLNAEEAKNNNVVEYIAEDIPDLLEQVDGETIKNRQLNTSGANIVNYEPGLNLYLMNIISNPIISSLLLMIGIYAIVLGISSPGAGAEIFGAILIALGLIGMGFDVNVAALFLIGVGVVLLILELQAPGFGIFGIAGIVCLIAGSIFLIPMDFPRWYTPADVQRSMMFYIVIPTIIIGLFFAFAIYKVVQAKGRKPIIGEEMNGEIAEAIDPISEGSPGYVRYSGEYWKARSEDTINPEEKVEILEKDGPVLIVRKFKGK
ncbi:MAG: membrane-bound serine protease (ClpP class) [Methanohalophilus sp. T328-1]|jgi:membrane-bound serine protease (ClpP class)|uniref:Nodulation efficiency protein NfeD n=1 Tax=Methanohalophilus euhalobius TaxID=51203 RepID=A0A285FDF5_9EURY|nr:MULTISPECIES: nodulation protein NfeD [Methanohalophilus]KXS40386.1 MAG: membrane-bound serine protease (ClpP class) [Methanohalophilus sp. T328-1]RSD34797.1 MAG: membrane-bound serine protease (ClpP class) [Methanohalophilus sp.]ODV50143.1 MAG: membrane-bound serine protease (ClpP class) [Methanohalophilus sp. 2-GBenrich]RSD35193.1 MAG: membrane-bound serine protease (ClpP class) [Methanohalophilus sp.]RXG33448.1 membrane-bound serine protease (ClpP class) [Methanohalophilus sp. WG1-DM]